MDKNTVNKTVMFTVGAMVGSAATWKLLKTKYKNIAQEEIDSVKEAFLSKKKDKDTGKQIFNGFERGLENPNEEVKKAVDVILKEGYVNDKVEGGENEDMIPNEPYVIPPEDFGDCGYETTSLTYYADGVLADDMDELIEDIDSVVGLDSLTCFGEYENDSVFVRNDDRETDYEILLDTRKYSEVYPFNAHE